MCAGWLAKQEALGRDSLVYWDNPPQGMGKVLLADAKGTEYSRD